jgi:hypothetical protein
MNWGDNLALAGAIHRRGWVALSTGVAGDDRQAVPRLGPHEAGSALRPGAIVVLDNLAAQKQAAIAAAIRRGGARVNYLPPALISSNRRGRS